MEFVGERRRRMLPSGASLFSAYASLSATFTLLQQAFYQFVPPAVRAYLCELFQRWFTRKPPPSPDLFQLIIEENYGLNQIFEACQIYLCHKLSDSSNVLKVSRAPNEETMSFKLAEGVKFSETFEGIHLKWSFLYTASSSPKAAQPPVDYRFNEYHPSREKQSGSSEKSYFSLVFDKVHKKKVCSTYLPFVMETSKDIVREEKLLKLFDCNARYFGSMHGSGGKSSVNMTHPFKFENLAMDPESKKAIMDDLDRFVRRKEFYRRVGKPWKRGYLLYGPLGTGKSSLIAAMANYLKFDIYDLQLARVNDANLRGLLLCIPSRSILVIEDIDCSRGLPRRELDHPMYPGFNIPEKKPKLEPQMSLAALLNFADGLWSCCGDERLIVFTTNHKEKLDPALLRAGRMDMHIHMSYLTMEGFKILAYNYLLVSSNHHLFGEIESLLEAVNVTPAEVAEELLRSEDADIALQGVVDLLKRKKAEAENSANLEISDGKNSESAVSGEAVIEEIMRSGMLVQPSMESSNGARRRTGVNGTVSLEYLAEKEGKCKENGNSSYVCSS